MHGAEFLIAEFPKNDMASKINLRKNAHKVVTYKNNELMIIITAAAVSFFPFLPRSQREVHMP